MFLALMVLLAGPGDTMLSRAVFADGRLWLKSDDGRVFSVAEGEKTKRTERVDLTLDLCVFQGHVLALTRAAKVARLQAAGAEGAWKPTTTLAAHIEYGNLACDGDTVWILAVDHLVTWRAGKETRVALSEKVGGFTVSIYPTAERVLVGMNLGEWGGGLRSIDPKSGTVKLIEKRKDDGNCSGPLNPKCDPVHGVAAAPWKPECQVLAVGLVHFDSSGSLLLLCGDQVEPFVSRPLEGGSKRKNDRYGQVAFVGLARTNDTLWAAGIDGLYEVTEKGVTKTALPKFTDAGGVQVSFALPGLVLVQTEVSRRGSVSGAVPMLVAR